MKPITTFGLAIALLAVLTTAGSSLAAGNTPICMLLHPSGTRAVKINLNDTCRGHKRHGYLPPQGQIPGPHPAIGRLRRRYKPLARIPTARSICITTTMAS